MTMTRQEEIIQSCTIDIDPITKSVNLDYQYRKDIYKADNISFQKIYWTFKDIENLITRDMHGCCGLKLWSTGILRDIDFTIREKSENTYKDIFKIKKSGIKETGALNFFQEVESQYYRHVNCNNTQVYTRVNVK